jgi:predicted RND superfamily exporter protein
LLLVLLGTMRIWDIELDPLVMINILMAVGFSVDYTAHVTYHYYKSSQVIVRFKKFLEMFFLTIEF